MKIYKRILCFLMAMAIFIGVSPYSFAGEVHDHTDTLEVQDENIASVTDTNEFKGKTISILGASISTYAGTSNGAAADTTNSTIRNNVKYYPNSTISEVTLQDTWWMQVVNDLDLRLLVNNAWSGSAILLERSGTVGAYVDRCVQLHDDTGENAGETPDIIAIQMGFNDFSYGKATLGTADIDYDKLITKDGYGTPSTTMEAIAIMLDKITKRYPDVEIYMFNHFKRIGQTQADTELMENLNASIETVCGHFDVKVVDLYTVFNSSDYIGDGRLHPNRLGMDVISEAVKSTILKNTKYHADTHTVTFDLTDVTADYGTDKIVLNGDPFAVYLKASDMLSVTVMMDDQNITDDVYDNGKITIENVTADVIITAKNMHEPQNYHFDFNGTDLVSVGETENILTKTAGTTTNGIFNKTRYSLEKRIVLNHSEPWAVEWRCEGTFLNTNGSSGARIFTTTPVNAEYHARYIFKSNTNGLIAMGEKDTKGSHNYGIALGDHGIDWTELHTYRLENRIADDGSNMIWLYVDGKEIGPMTGYYIGTNSQNKTSDWLSGKDFTFGYMGTDTHGFTNCKIEYIKVWEDGISEENAEQLSLRYDDRYDVTGKTVEIIDAGKPTSYKVGYGVAEGTLDDAVITLDGDQLIATGIGAAKVRIDGVLYEMTVEAAPISLLLLIGQSNMRGSEGNANQSIVCPDGMVYATYGDDRGADNTAMSVSNAAQFVPSALTGVYSSINVEGTTACLSGYPVTSLTESGAGKIGPDSGFAYEWVKQTGEKVWIVNAAHGGTSIKVWQPGTTEYEQYRALFTACQETLRKEIAAGHFTLSHMGYFWCQGCSDRTQSAAWYVEKYLAMHEGFKTELSFDHDSNSATADKTLEFGGIILVRVGSTVACYRDGAYSVSNPYSYHESFVDLRFSGPRVAQYWMINNPDLPDIWGVCNIGEDWVWMPDGTNGVSDYFNAHYPNGRVDYTTQVAQKESWYTPTTPKAVHDSIHYNQIGYNEIGRESVRNVLIMLGEKEAPTIETEVKFVGWDGYNEVSEIKAFTVGNSGTLVVPMVTPLWKSKDITYTLSDGLTYEYYDLLATDAQTVGALRADGEHMPTVTVAKQEPGLLFADHLSALPEKICQGLNLWTVLEHDKEYFASGTNWAVYSGGNVCSVTIPVKAGDKIFATSFGKANENGHDSSNGIRMTFFSEYGLAKSMTPAETYAEFSKNGGYLIASEGAIAVNIPMWNNSDDNEIYILNYAHSTDEGICEICGKNAHTHTWSEWKTVSLPTIDALGVEEGSCSCGEKETRDVEGVWQKYDLAKHYSELPEKVCQGLNLWNVLEHDKEYFANGTGWAIYSGGTVCSVTIPVKAGDKIFATSFGKGGENGNKSTNGIRMTFFDVYGTLKTLAPEETYAEFTANGGYLVAPEGAIAVNIPMWNDSDENELYILNCDHNYKGIACAICGAKHPEAENYKSKVISILGGSNCTFAGYIPVADGFNLTHRARYPQDNLLTDVNDTWWMQTLTALDAKLGINDSWAGSQVLNTMDGNSGDLGEDASMASLTRIQNLGSNGTPDVILFFGGCNDMGRGVTLGSFDSVTAPTHADLTATKWDSFADAYVAAVLRMRHFYPDAQILVMLPYNSPSYFTAEKVESYGTVIKAICDHYGVTYVDLRDCGITSSDLPDGIHPNAAGSDYITDAVLGALLSDVEVEAGENVVYSVTHDLNNVKGSLGYYKGISAGESFAENLKGENISVTVTMGGKDVTSEVYRNGKITISEVTGDIVITASGTYDYDGHLQMLPENICGGINIWALLSPVNEYYTANGWGVTGAGKQYSVTFPVNVGERIWATSFGTQAVNQLSGNGTRITWFSEEGVLKSLPRDVVYAEFVANGYITVPEGAIALNIPMASADDTWEIYLLDREHEYTSAITLPTCTEKGYTTHICKMCGASYIDDYVEAKGHTVVTDKALASTCTETGLTEGKHCSVCGEILVKQEVVKAKGHTVVIDQAVAPTCTETGLTEGKHCSVCGEILIKQEVVKANGHNYNAIVTSPTCTEKGYTTHICDGCGDSYIDTYVDSLGHNFTNYISDGNATITADGTKTAKCDRCDVTDTIVDVGSKMEYIPGDINGDEILNPTDALYLLRHVLMPMLYPVAQSADMNGDGAVNAADAIYLLRHVLMPNLYPLT